MALPMALMASLDPDGNFQLLGNPCKMACSAAVQQRTVCPSGWHHVSGWLAVHVNASRCTDRMQSLPSRLLVFDLRYWAGSGWLAAAKACRLLL